MQKITTIVELKDAIQQLENRQTLELSLLKEQIHITSENLKPFNVLKNTFKDVASSNSFKDNLLGTTIGITTGLLSKVLVSGFLNNPIKKILGTFLQVGVSTIVSKHPEKIKSLVHNITNFFNKKKPFTNQKLNGKFI